MTEQTENGESPFLSNAKVDEENWTQVEKVEENGEESPSNNNDNNTESVATPTAVVEGDDEEPDEEGQEVPISGSESNNNTESPLDIPTGNDDPVAVAAAADEKKSTDSPVKRVGRQVLERASASMRQVQGHVGQAMQKAGPSVRQVMEKAGPSVRQAMEKVGPSMRQLGEQVGQVTAQKSRELSVGTQMAVAAATASTAHTLNQIGSNPMEQDETTGQHKVKGEKTDGFITGIHDYGIQGLSIVGFLAAVISMILIEAHLVDFTSLLTMILCPLIFWQKTQLKSLGGMRGQQNSLREKVNTLTNENAKLTSSIDVMEQQVEQLKHVEGELDSIAVKSGGQVDRIVNVVHENGLLQAQIKEMLDDEVLQQLLTAILVTNHNGDNVLCKLELRQLEYKFRNIPGIIFHKDRFQAFCENDEGEMTIADITKIVHNLRDPTTPKENCVFEYDTKALVHKKKQGGEDEGASPTTEADIPGEDEEARPATAADI